MTNFLYKNDLPDDIKLGKEIAIDTETLGLNNFRDRLCMVQISSGDGNAHLINFDRDSYKAPNLKKLLSDDSVLKIMHYARFDMAIMQRTFGIELHNIYCTKIASKVARTYSHAHGLKVLVEEFVGFLMSKRQQSSYWGTDEVSNPQIKYAASDVLYLHKIRDGLEDMLEREGRKKLAHDCFKCLNAVVNLDLAGWTEHDIFNFSS